VTGDLAPQEGGGTIPLESPPYVLASSGITDLAEHSIVGSKEVTLLPCPVGGAPKSTGDRRGV
jgi:hypothetical protein